jgi:hypothetical protein
MENVHVSRMKLKKEVQKSLIFFFNELFPKIKAGRAKGKLAFDTIQYILNLDQ